MFIREVIPNRDRYANTKGLFGHEVCQDVALVRAGQSQLADHRPFLKLQAIGPADAFDLARHGKLFIRMLPVVHRDAAGLAFQHEAALPRERFDVGGGRREMADIGDRLRGFIGAGALQPVRA